MAKLSWLLVVLSLVIGLQSQAASGFKGSAAALFLQQETEGTSISNSESELTEYNVKVGYLNSQVYYAVLFDSWTSGNASRNSTGAVIGYHGKAWYVDGTFFVTSEYKTATGTTLKEGSGMGVDIGYNFLKDSAKYLAGVQVSYKSFEYKKVESLTEKNKHTETIPMLMFGMTFAR